MISTKMTRSFSVRKQGQGRFRTKYGQGIGEEQVRMTKGSGCAGRKAFAGSSFQKPSWATESATVAVVLKRQIRAQATLKLERGAVT